MTAGPSVEGLPRPEEQRSRGPSTSSSYGKKKIGMAGKAPLFQCLSLQGRQRKGGAGASPSGELGDLVTLVRVRGCLALFLNGGRQ